MVGIAIGGAGFGLDLPLPPLVAKLLGRDARLPGPPDVLAWSADGRYVVAGVDGGESVRVDRRGRPTRVPLAGLHEVRLAPDGEVVLGAREADFVAVDIAAAQAEQLVLGESQGKPVLWLRGPFGDVVVTRQVSSYRIRRSGAHPDDPDAAPTRNFRAVWLDPQQPLAYVDTGYGLEIRHALTGLTLRTFDSGHGEQRYLGVGADPLGRMVLASQDADGFRTWAPPEAPGEAWDVDGDAPKAIAPDGVRVAVGTDKGVQLYAAASRQRERLLRTYAPVVRVAFAPDATAVAAATSEGRVRVWTLEPAPGEAVPARASAEVDVGRIREPEHLAEGGLVRLRPSRELRLGGAASHLAWSPAGHVGGWVGDALTDVDPATGEARALRVQGLTGRPWAWSPDGQALAVVTDEGVAVYDARRWRVRHTLPTGGGHLQLQWRGDTLLVDVGGGRAQAWDAVAGAPLGPPYEATTEATARFVLSPDGRRVAVTGRTARVLRSADGVEEGLLDAQWAGVMAATWSPDGSLLATAGGDGTLVLWGADLAPVRLVEGAHGRELAFSPDGGRILAAGWGGAYVADVATGQLQQGLVFEGLLAGAAWGEAGVALVDSTGGLSLWSL
ncbi:MAG: WD40 repeat domain-containing protein [Myxococcota bacterium]